MRAYPQRLSPLFLSLVAFLLIIACTNSPPETPSLRVLPEPNYLATNSPPQKTHYLGQTEPGAYPSRFAYGMVTGSLHSVPVFTPDNREVYWAQQGAKILRSRLENGEWKVPETINFSSSLSDYRDPFISPSGEKLFFLSKGYLPNSSLPEKENIWYVERTGTGWGRPIPLDERVNSFSMHWQISVAANGNLYFGATADGGDIYVSRYSGGDYGIPEKLGETVNTKLMEITPFIAADESYLIFTRFDSGNGTPSLYVSLAEENGGWGKALPVDRIQYGLCPIVTRDGKYLLFLSSPSSVSWMTMEFLHDQH